MNLQIQPRRPEDLPFVAAVFADARAHEFAILNLPPQALDQLLSMQFQAQCDGYLQQFPNAQDFVILCDDQPVGRIMIHRAPDELLLMDIAVLSAHRNRGIGSSLLQFLIHEAAAASIPLRLSVRFGSPAERLYQRAGLVRTGGDGMNVHMELRPTPALAAPAHPQPAPGPQTETSPAGGPVLSSEFFRGFLGQTLTFRTSAGAVDLRLDNVSPLALQRDQPGIELGDSFVLELSGPLQPLVPGELALCSAAGGDSFEMSVTALGPVDGRMSYESIFNRMRHV